MSHSVTLSWVASTDAVDGYQVFRGTAAGAESATPLNAALITGTTYTDATAIPGKSFYIVKASLDGVLSAASDEVTVSLPPAAPTNLTVTAQS